MLGIGSALGSDLRAGSLVETEKPAWISRPGIGRSGRRRPSQMSGAARILHLVVGFLRDLAPGKGGAASAAPLCARPGRLPGEREVDPLSWGAYAQRQAACGDPAGRTAGARRAHEQVTELIKAAGTESP